MRLPSCWWWMEIRFTPAGTYTHTSPIWLSSVFMIPNEPTSKAKPFCVVCMRMSAQTSPFWSNTMVPCLLAVRSLSAASNFSTAMP